MSVSVWVSECILSRFYWFWLKSAWFSSEFSMDYFNFLTGQYYEMTMKSKAVTRHAPFPSFFSKFQIIGVSGMLINKWETRSVSYWREDIFLLSCYLLNWKLSISYSQSFCNIFVEKEICFGSFLCY